MLIVGASQVVTLTVLSEYRSLGRLDPLRLERLCLDLFLSTAKELE